MEELSKHISDDELDAGSDHEAEGAKDRSVHDEGAWQPTRWTPDSVANREKQPAAEDKALHHEGPYRVVES